MRNKIALLFFIGLAAAAACVSHAVPPSSEPAARSATYEQALERGIVLLGRGEYGKAAAEFGAAIAVNPGSAHAHNYLGLCYFHDRSYEPAKAQFEKAAAADPAFAAAVSNLAGVYFVRSEFPKAEELYKKALALAPDLISANYSLGTLLCNLGRVDEGSGYLTHGIALDPDYLDKHAELVTKFSSLSFDPRQTCFAFARAFAAQGNVEKAVEYLDKAREAGFADWWRILREAQFDKVRDDPRIQAFLKIQGS